MLFGGSLLFAQGQPDSSKLTGIEDSTLILNDSTGWLNSDSSGWSNDDSSGWKNDDSNNWNDDDSIDWSNKDFLEPADSSDSLENEGSSDFEDSTGFKDSSDFSENNDSDFSAVVTDDSTGVYVIESYVKEDGAKPEIIVYFFTSEPVKATIVFNDSQKFTVSDTLADSFRFSIELTAVKSTSQNLKCVIYTENAGGVKSSSDEFDIVLPYEPQMEGTALGYLADCTLGGITFLVPSIGITRFKGETHFTLFKELPLIVFQNEISDLPWMAFSIEYAHIPKISWFKYHDEPLPGSNSSGNNSNLKEPSETLKNRFFAGFKFPFEVPYIKYIAPGVSFTTNFLGANGISPEVSFGFFDIFRVINFNLKARYNWYPSSGNLNNIEFNIGLTSYFLTIAF
ncbi:MAG: hypothetical protein B6D45_06370 [Ignavibacteriales bacterium UTCHB3]|nr:MAG: hypothetical protein B6D45_06370 [Ignavibacteriales bacterium UTCHB3]